MMGTRYWIILAVCAVLSTAAIVWFSFIRRHQTPTAPLRHDATVVSGEAAEKPASLGSLRMRTCTIHLYVDHYSVEGADGKPLAEMITGEELRRRFPELHHRLDGLLAAAAWAGM